jgi:AraC-like DNA-binding protein/quercetin dioxygenase-like cupin family protein
MRFMTGTVSAAAVRRLPLRCQSVSRNGQAPLSEPIAMTRPVRALAVSVAAGHRIPRHRHAVAQLIHAVAGVMTVTTRDGSWVVPPLRAVYVPPGVEHAIRMTGDVAMRTVYVARPLADALPRACCVVHVSPLLRELILRAVAFPPRWADDGVEARIAALIVDEIRGARVAPLHLPRPADPRALRVARALEADPGDARPLAQWAKSAGASGRTLARLFERETGLSFGAWRQQLRLLRALERLAAGDAVTAVALDLGYESPSAFIAMFRKALGVSPGRYFAEPS